MASMYNAKLKVMVDQYNAQLQESKFLYWDAYSFVLNVIKNYASYGKGMNSLKYATEWDEALKFPKV